MCHLVLSLDGVSYRSRLDKVEDGIEIWSEEGISEVALQVNGRSVGVLKIHDPTISNLDGEKLQHRRCALEERFGAPLGSQVEVIVRLFNKVTHVRPECASKEFAPTQRDLKIKAIKVDKATGGKSYRIMVTSDSGLQNINVHLMDLEKPSSIPSPLLDKEQERVIVLLLAKLVPFLHQLIVRFTATASLSKVDLIKYKSLITDNFFQKIISFFQEEVKRGGVDIKTGNATAVAAKLEVKYQDNFVEFGYQALNEIAMQFGLSVSKEIVSDLKISTPELTVLNEGQGSIVQVIIRVFIQYFTDKNTEFLNHFQDSLSSEARFTSFQSQVFHAQCNEDFVVEIINYVKTLKASRVEQALEVIEACESEVGTDLLNQIFPELLNKIFENVFYKVSEENGFDLSIESIRDYLNGGSRKRKANAGDGGAAKIGSSSSTDIDQEAKNIEKIGKFLSRSLKEEFRELFKLFFQKLGKDKANRVLEGLKEISVIVKNNIEASLNTIKTETILKILTLLNSHAGIKNVRELVPLLPNNFFINMFREILDELSYENDLEGFDDETIYIAGNAVLNLGLSKKVEVKAIAVRVTEVQKEIAKSLNRVLSPLFVNIVKKLNCQVEGFGENCNTVFLNQINKVVIAISEEKISDIHETMGAFGDLLGVSEIDQIFAEEEELVFLNYFFGDVLEEIVKLYYLGLRDDQIEDIVNDEVKAYGDL